MNSSKVILFCLVFLCSTGAVNSQSSVEIIENYFNSQKADLNLNPSDVSNWIITDEYKSEHNGVTHIYVRQLYNNIELFNGTANFNIKDGKVISMGNRLLSNISHKVISKVPTITPVEAVSFAADYFNLNNSEELRIIKAVSLKEYLISKADISQKDIPVKLVYFGETSGDVKLTWDLSIYLLNSKNWYSVRIDALNGDVVDVIDWVLHCEFEEDDKHVHTASTANTSSPKQPLSKKAPDSYQVFDYPVESPNHGSRTTVVNPSDPLSSPFGWHDIDGVAGAEFTITRGNNVHASEDADDDNNPGYSPDGGATLDFVFPLNLNQAPANYFDAAITNLFYWNNLMHDVWYQYGFDEVSGNFQDNNYGKGGTGGDYVFADAQDGGGTNNANFATPSDGNNPRMQMFLWTNGGAASNLLTVNSPGNISGGYSGAQSSFGPPIGTTPITSDVVLVLDNGGADNTDACDPITNGSNLIGKIALVNRGNCNFTTKVQAAQDEGAIAVIIANNVGGAPFSAGGFTTTITIPSIMISQADGLVLFNELNGGSIVNATLVDSSGTFDIDGDFDNGVIAHEYGHGISNRLTGGPSNTGCLSNAEQMGEGWSDYFGMVMTIEPGDNASDVRGVGTYASGQATSGNGIRPAPYSTDFAINSFTYDATNFAGITSQPHGIGFVWATMLWDLTWTLIDIYGFDPDIYNGTGGNNMAMQLVIDGMKMQPCNPGFVDGRDAILLADQVLYGGANHCTIWQVFADRGLGASASQGSSASRSDQVEAFDLPNSCLVATVAPTANFNPSATTSCNGIFTFEDASTNIPQFFHWDFGDGDTSTLTNPTHEYTSEGSFTVTLTVSNNIGSDVSTLVVQVDFPDDPIVFIGNACVDEVVQLNAIGTDEIRWYNSNDLNIATGPLLFTPPLAQTTTYEVENVVLYPSQNIGPIDNNFGGGGYHGTNFTGTVDFTAAEALLIVSSFVDVEYAGIRDFFLWDAASASGNIIQTVTVDIPFAGAGRIDLGFEVPGPGEYSIGATGVDMYRNNTGATYPYTIAGLMTLTGSSAGPDFYYYLYDLEVQKAPCRSNRVPIVVNVSDAGFTYLQSGNTYNFTSSQDTANSYLWDFGDGNSSMQANPVHTYNQNGVYIVSLTVDGACTKKDTITGSLGIPGIINSLNFDVSPNPADRIVLIKLNSIYNLDILVTLYSAEGKKLSTDIIKAGAKNHELNLSNLASGVYFIELSNQAKTVTEKIILH